MAERLNAAALKAVDPVHRIRGFESHPLRSVFACIAAHGYGRASAKGDTGPQGAAGPAGAAGAPGSDATVDTSAFVRRGSVSTVTGESDIAVPPNSTITAGTLSCPVGGVPARGRYALSGDPVADEVTESLDGKAYVVKVSDPTAQTQFGHVKLGLACADLDVPAPPLP